MLQFGCVLYCFADNSVGSIADVVHWKLHFVSSSPSWSRVVKNSLV